MTSARWEPYSEPLSATLLRTVGIALVVGAAMAPAWGGLSRWPIATLVMLWPSLGGHFLELWFLNWLRPRLSASRAVQVVARVAVWFVGGILFGLGMALTARTLGNYHPLRWPAWWLAGVGFIVVELVAQLGLQLRGRPSFYNARG
jgi:hypothetical protein